MQKILFLCPHGAAKSVLAAAYFNEMAEEKGLGFTAENAGSEPDEATAPHVVELLRSEGVDVSDYMPRLVTQADVDAAVRVVSLGCPLGDLDAAEEKLLRWNDIPPPSQALTAARDLIYARVRALVNELGARA